MYSIVPSYSDTLIYDNAPSYSTVTPSSTALSSATVTPSSTINKFVNDDIMYSFPFQIYCSNTRIAAYVTFFFSVPLRMGWVMGNVPQRRPGHSRKHRRRIELEDKAKGRRTCFVDRIIAAVAALPRKRLNSAGLFDRLRAKQLARQ